MLVLKSQPASTHQNAERTLVSRAQAEDRDAFCELCRLHGGALLRHATVLCGDSAMAEDLVQESLIEAWKSISRYNGQCQFFTWLSSILLHRHRNLLRKRKPIALSFLWRWEQERAEEQLINVADLNPGPDEFIQRTERAMQVMRSLQRLPRKQREVVYLRFYAHESLEGISAAVGCSVGTVKSRLFNGLEQLRKMKSLDESKNL